jgi:hypothetical protein
MRFLSAVSLFLSVVAAVPVQQGDRDYLEAPIPDVSPLVSLLGVSYTFSKASRPGTEDKSELELR